MAILDRKTPDRLWKAKLAAQARRDRRKAETLVDIARNRGIWLDVEDALKILQDFPYKTLDALTRDW